MEQTEIYAGLHRSPRVFMMPRRCSIGCGNARALSVLLVTDRPEDFVDAIAAMRAQLLDVEVFQDGWKAYARAPIYLPKVVMLDAEMRTMDGMTICRLLKRLPALGQTPFILFSRSFDSRERLKALELGIADCVSMPFLPQELMLRLSAKIRSTFRACSSTPCALRTSRVSSNSTTLQSALEAIENSNELTFSVKTLAKCLGTSERRLTAVFKEQLGMAVSKYIQAKKMEMACRLLHSTDMPIQQISVSVGFRSPCNFSVAFSQHVGMTPTQYRAGVLTTPKSSGEAVAVAHFPDRLTAGAC